MDAPTPGATDSDDVRPSIATAESLVAAGRIRDAIDLLTEANRRQRHPLLEVALAGIRHGGYDRVVNPPATPGPVGSRVTFDFIDGLPAVTPGNLTPSALTQAIGRYGCLFVPGLLDEAQVAAAVHGIDRAFEELDRYEERPLAPRTGDQRAWFEPFKAVGPYAGMEFGGRSFTRSTGGVWTIESPRMLFHLTELFQEIGLVDAIAGHLDEHPAMSAAKCNIRRTPAQLPGGWHQDGSFVGTDITSVDAWIALSPCGRDSPGLDVVPHRFEDLLPAGPDTVVIPHETVVHKAAEVGAGIVGREYAPGDALLFDHLFVHRTAVSPGMTLDRYALETWFFGPSRYPASQIPILC